MRNDNFEKTKASIRYWQLGAGYFEAAKMMDFAEKIHIGLRKDGITHEFSHQVAQANYVRTIIPSLMYPERVLKCVWAHDTVEDYPEIANHLLIAQKFGAETSDDIELMTNNIVGVKKNDTDYYNAIAQNPVASIAKGVDNIHNFASMVGVFSVEKLEKKVKFAREYVLPMLKTARRLFPEQEAAYQNIRTVLLVQLDLIEVIVKNFNEMKYSK